MYIGSRAEPTKSTGDALYNAALHGDTETVRVLCNTGAPVNFTNVNDWSPLSIAAHKNHVDCVAILAAHRADINTQNKFGLTPLIFAAQQEGYETVRLLIALGADLELCGTHGTAQHYANGCCVELLQNTVKGGGSVQQLRAQNNEAILSHPEAFPSRASSLGSGGAGGLGGHRENSGKQACLCSINSMTASVRTLKWRSQI